MRPRCAQGEASRRPCGAQGMVSVTMERAKRPIWDLILVAFSGPWLKSTFLWKLNSRRNETSIFKVVYGPKCSKRGSCIMTSLTCVPNARGNHIKRVPNGTQGGQGGSKKLTSCPASAPRAPRELPASSSRARRELPKGA